MAKQFKDKPFPWVCPACAERTVVEDVIPFEVHSHHDNREVVFVVPNLRTPKCSNCGEVFLTTPASVQIANATRKHLGLLSPEEIKSQVHDLGITQKRLAQEMNVSAETLSRWVSGTIIQSKNSDNRLRKALDEAQRRKSSQSISSGSLAMDFAAVWDTKVRDLRGVQELVCSFKSAWGGSFCMDKQ